MGRTSTKTMTVILEADPDEEGWFDLVSVNGKTPDQVEAEPTLSQREKVEVEDAIKNGDPEATGLILDLKPKATGERLTDEQCLVELWSQVGTDAFWSHDEPPDMQGKPYLKLVGHIWWEEYNSVDHGREYDEGFEIEEQEVLDDLGTPIREDYIASEPDVDSLEAWDAWWDGLTRQEREHVLTESGYPPERVKECQDDVRELIRKAVEKRGN